MRYGFKPRVLFKALKRAPSTRQILKDSIKDIEAGLWMCGELVNSCKINGNKKPMGCAIGLVGINARISDIYVEDTGYDYFEDVDDEPKEEWANCDIEYPHDSNWPKSALKAIELLAQTADLSARKIKDIDLEIAKESQWDYDVLKPTYRQETLVLAYNDTGRKGKNLRKEDALAWFKRALELA